MTASRRMLMTGASLGLLLSVVVVVAPVWAEGYEVTRDVEFARPGGIPLKCDVYRPEGDGPFPTVLCVHGGAWFAGTRGQLTHVAVALAQSGYAAVSVEYRLAPIHKFPAQLDDLRTALHWLETVAGTYQLDLDRLAVWGYSAGGHLAALLATRQDDSSGEPRPSKTEPPPRIRAVVAGGSPCDLRQLKAESRVLTFFLGGTRAEMPEQYEAASPMAHVSADDPPMFFYHGEYDIVVPPAQPRDMSEALRKAGVQSIMYTVPKVGHHGALFSRDAVARGRVFLDARLTGDDG